MNNSTIRNEIKQKRRALSQEMIAAQALAFLAQIQKYFIDKTAAQKIGIYLAANGELDLGPSVEWLWQQGHLLYTPVIQGEALQFCEYTQATPLAPNQFGILEPVTKNEIAAEDLDFVLVPLVAFDKHNHRLGMGKGYYDRAFAFRKIQDKPILIGCAYDFQEVAKIKTQKHDIAMDVVLTITSPLV